MTVYKVTVKSTFYVEADTMPGAKEIADRAIGSLPQAECNIKATKKLATEFAAYGDRG